MRRGKYIYIYIFFKNRENFIRKLNSTTNIAIGGSVFFVNHYAKPKIENLVFILVSTQDKFYNNIFYCSIINFHYFIFKFRTIVFNYIF